MYAGLGRSKYRQGVSGTLVTAGGPVMSPKTTSAAGVAASMCSHTCCLTWSRAGQNHQELSDGRVPTPQLTFPEPRHGCRSSRAPSSTLARHRVGALPAGSDMGHPVGTELLCALTLCTETSAPQGILITALKGVKRFLPTHTWPSSGAGSQSSPWQN